MDFFDRLTIDASTRRRTQDGYLVVTGKIARTGIQIYTGDEVGRPGIAEVRVYRDEAEVFDEKALASFAHRPVTNDHPAQGVNASNWKQHAVGMIGDKVVRDGEEVSVPFVVMDKAAIDAVESGKVELSAGYSCELVFGDGETPTGLKYDAKQTNIRANHLAIVDRARGGPTLRIGDETKMEKVTVLVDGLQVETTPAGKIAIDKLMSDAADLRKQIAAASDALAAERGTHAAAISAKDGEIAALKASVLSDEAKTKLISDGVAELARVTADALRITAGVQGFKIADGASAPAIRQAVVIARLGDAACKKADGAVEDQAFFDHAFRSLLAQVPVQQTDAYRTAIQTAVPAGDKTLAQIALDKETRRLADAHKQPAAAA